MIMTYNRSIEELEQQAVKWWPVELSAKDANTSIIPKLLETQDDFLQILALSKQDPYQFLELIGAAKFPTNVFLKHLCVLADYGGEPIQRLGRSFSDIFQNRKMSFTWSDSQKYEFAFTALPVKGLNNKRLLIDGEGLNKDFFELTPLYKDLIVLLMHGSASEQSEEAGLSACEIGTLLGKKDELKQYVKQRYIIVSRITGGAKANSLGQYAQQHVVEVLRDKLGNSFDVVSNGKIRLSGYDKPDGMPFDIVISKGSKKIGVEISFQVTTNSTIERKSGQASERRNLMNQNGHHIAFVLDGAGNFQRRSAISTICENSECTVAYSASEFEVLAEWVKSKYD